jgi:hypothetical protein
MGVSADEIGPHGWLGRADKAPKVPLKGHHNMHGTKWLRVVSCTICLLAVGDLVSGQNRGAAYRIVDTGQTRCFGISEEIPFPKPLQPFFGQDAQYQGNTPAYRDHGDGTITDLVTGLTWQKTPDFVTRTWEDARRYASSLALGSHQDWRLPAIKELFSIADFRGNMHTRTPYIDTKYFDFQYPSPTLGVREMDAQYWSSTRYVGTTMRGDESVFGFNFADGRIKSYPISFGRTRGRQGPMPGVRKYVRCVRGPDYGANQFVDHGDGTVTDRATELIWMKSDSGKTMDWQQALRFAEELEHAGYDDWRLPNVKELQGIVDYRRAPDARDPSLRTAAIDPVFQLTDQESWFWTSTTHLEHRFGAYYVCFGQATSTLRWNGKPINAHGAGAVRSDPKAGDPADWANGLGPQSDEIRIYNYVRAVRGGAETVIENPNGESPRTPSRFRPPPPRPRRPPLRPPPRP